MRKNSLADLGSYEVNDSLNISHKDLEKSTFPLKLVVQRLRIVLKHYVRAKVH